MLRLESGHADNVAGKCKSFFRFCLTQTEDIDEFLRLKLTFFEARCRLNTRQIVAPEETKI